MKDRLLELQNISKLQEEDEALSPDGRKAEQYVVVFEGEDQMQAVHKEAQSIRKEILHLRMDVKSLVKQNARFLTSMRRASSIKRDANAIGRDIKARGEAVYARLEQFRARASDDPQEALSRMVHSQHAFLTAALREEISEYHGAEMAQMEHCKQRIQRQAEIVGQQVSRQEIDQMVQSGQWNVFTDAPLLEGRSARSALSEIETRHKELLDLEGRVRDVHELFSLLAQQVEQQGGMLDNIQAQVQATQEHVVRAREQITQAVAYRRRGPCRRLLCCCCP